MSRRLRFHPEGPLELEAAGEAHGHAFAAPTWEKLQQLLQLPYAWPTWPGRDDVCRRVLTRWIYSVIYSVDDASVFIVALAHDRRQPGYWLPRL